MSRELKFRGWDIKNQQFVNTYDYACQFDGSTIYNHDHYEWTSYLNSTIQIQQYTGLLDKNGKDIYEGDIVKVGFGEHEGSLGKVIFRYGSFMLTSKHGYIFMDTYKSCLYGEVIGNIYENSELLK